MFLKKKEKKAPYGSMFAKLYNSILAIVILDTVKNEEEKKSKSRRFFFRCKRTSFDCSSAQGFGYYFNNHNLLKRREREKKSFTLALVLFCCWVWVDGPTDKWGVLAADSFVWRGDPTSLRTTSYSAPKKQTCSPVFMVILQHLSCFKMEHYKYKYLTQKNKILALQKFS